MFENHKWRNPENPPTDLNPTHHFLSAYINTQNSQSQTFITTTTKFPFTKERKKETVFYFYFYFFCHQQFSTVRSKSWMADVAAKERKILVAVDEGEESMHALSWCLKNVVSENSKDTLSLLYVKPPRAVYTAIDGTGNLSVIFMGILGIRKIEWCWL